MCYIASLEDLHSHIRQAHQLDYDTHFRQIYEDDIDKDICIDDLFSFRLFLQEFLLLNCPLRWLTVEQVTRIKSGEDLPTKLPLQHNHEDSESMYPTLHTNKFPTVVRGRNGNWIPLRCPVCGTNAKSLRSEGSTLTGLKGLPGFVLHMERMHRVKAPNGAEKWTWAFNQCASWNSNGGLDVERVENGEIRIVLWKAAATGTEPYTQGSVITGRSLDHSDEAQSNSNRHREKRYVSARDLLMTRLIRVISSMSEAYSNAAFMPPPSLRGDLDVTRRYLTHVTRSWFLADSREH